MSYLLFSDISFFLLLLAWYSISFYFNSWETTFPLYCAFVLYYNANFSNLVFFTSSSVIFSLILKESFSFLCRTVSLLFILEGAARYAGLLLAPAEGFGLRPRPFLALRAKKYLFMSVLAQILDPKNSKIQNLGQNRHKKIFFCPKGKKRPRPKVEALRRS